MTDVATEADRTLLRRALELAENGRGHVSPNPVVGAVIARDGEVIGEGWHARLGEVHAEVAALADCRERGNDPAGATMFVSLEPCAHQGRQPPCTDAILAAGITRVVIGADDPSEKASGRGPGILRDEGIEVGFAEGAEAAAARLSNQAFRKFARTGRPLVVFKSAVTLDGFTATSGGSSQWISGPESRARVHRWRAEYDAVAVGIGTALADDPLLTARDLEPAAERQPTRIVFDSSARLPLNSQLVRSLAQAPVIVVAEPGAPGGPALRDAGVDVIEVAGDRERRVAGALAELGARGITSVLLEGGAGLAGAFLDAGEIDQLRLFVAPVVLGSGRPVLAGAARGEIADGERLLDLEWERSGEDLLIRGRLREW
ncbi:MAG TPA: bifunctional diaminohydroxyphosphoribosylaminopyrimidine deaminase/5-amino-6-(5-phosphoribosylamino)uracil reductase RibD [Solirubrobacterales bacterium]|nr:bifunctional diaminohydroxyphosphoribosylaminopyrimidine deaminase/5-amino-6-(5-phosphoribosylamino)uracil reductase RibD [Solirubrobacterales bacterium]